MILGQALFSFHLIPSEVLQAQAQRKKIVCIKTGVIKEPSLLAQISPLSSSCLCLMTWKHTSSTSPAVIDRIVLHIICDSSSAEHS